jgi:hypothetical protein
MSYIFGSDEWRKAYNTPQRRRIIWIYILFSDGSEVFLDQFEDWLSIQDYCNSNNLSIKELGLQFCSHRITESMDGCDGCYLIRSLRADFGEKTKHCYTIGRVSGDQIEKKSFVTPELIFSFSSTDPVETSFKEAIVYHDKRKTKAI